MQKKPNMCMHSSPLSLSLSFSLRVWWSNGEKIALAFNLDPKWPFPPRAHAKRPNFIRMLIVTIRMFKAPLEVAEVYR
jgi:hypothetical protein